MHNSKRIYACTHWVRRDLQEGTGLASDWQLHHSRHPSEQGDIFMCTSCVCSCYMYLLLLYLRFYLQGRLKKKSISSLTIICASAECTVVAAYKRHSDMTSIKRQFERLRQIYSPTLLIQHLWDSFYFHLKI